MPYDDAERRESAPTTDAPRSEVRPETRPETPPTERRREESGADAKAARERQDAERKKADDERKKAEDDRKRRRRKPFVIAVVVLIAIAAIVGGVLWWLSTKDFESTDDAYTDGRAITIAPQVAGYVVALDVGDNQRVHAGDRLVQISQREYIAARDQARGQLEAAQGQLAGAQAALDLARVQYPARLAAAQAQQVSAQATLTRAQADYRRQTSVAPAATTRQNVDEATAGQRQAVASVAEASANVKQAEPIDTQIAQAAAQVKQLQGQVAQAQAQLDRAEIDLGYTTVRAPQDGWITRRNVERGNYVTAGASITSLVSPEVWVTANFKESQLDRMRPGQRVDISVDAYPGLKLKGHVDSVQLGSGSRFTAFPPENATGNYVKIVQRVPVKVVIDSGLDPNIPLPLGISVVPSVNVK